MKACLFRTVINLKGSYSNIRKMPLSLKFAHRSTTSYIIRHKQ